MKTAGVCLPCFVDDLVGAMDLLDLPTGKKRIILARAFAYLGRETGSEAGWASTPSRHITALHRIVKSVAGLETPFAALREACNRVGVEIARKVRLDVQGLDGPERFRALARWAIAGNHLDFRTVGTGYGFRSEEIHRWLETLASQPLAVDHADRIRALVLDADEVLYIPDNVGEIALDVLLVEEIRRLGARVAVPYRGGPITSDAVREDFEAVGLDASADEIFEAGPDTLGISFEEMSDALGKALASAPVVITKGQANWYAVSEHLDEIPGAVACLLRTKCDAASAPLGVKAKDGVAAILKTAGGE